jgi:hypothetical protein
MKILTALVAIFLALFLFYQAHDMPGISLERFGYIGGAVILLFVTVVLFLPKQDEDRKF